MAVTLIALRPLATLGGPGPTDDPPNPAGKAGDGPKAAEVRRVVGTTPLFKRTTVGLPEMIALQKESPYYSRYGPNDVPKVEWLAELYAGVVVDLRKAGKPLIPPSVPSVLDDSIVFVNDRGVGKLAIGTDRSLNPPLQRGELLWNQDFLTFELALDLPHRIVFDSWRRNLDPSAVTNRTITGAYWAAGDGVLFIEDLCLPPPADAVAPETGKYATPRANLGKVDVLHDYVLGNEVKLVDPVTGKLRFKLTRNWDMHGRAGPFGGNIFLGVANLPKGPASRFLQANGHGGAAGDRRLLC
jgi:hypothetical protein